MFLHIIAIFFVLDNIFKTQKKQKQEHYSVLAFE